MKSVIIILLVLAICSRGFTQISNVYLPNENVEIDSNHPILKLMPEEALYGIKLEALYLWKAEVPIVFVWRGDYEYSSIFHFYTQDGDDLTKLGWLDIGIIIQENGGEGYYSNENIQIYEENSELRFVFKEDFTYSDDSYENHDIIAGRVYKILNDRLIEVK